jgi:hypothetical protein
MIAKRSIGTLSSLSVAAGGDGRCADVHQPPMTGA